MKAVSTIIGGILIILILISSLTLIYIIISNQNDLQQSVISEINEKINTPILNEVLINGEAYLITTKPTIISHIIYPNGSTREVNIPIHDKLLVKNILNNSKWAIIVTKEGYWINITYINNNDNTPSSINSLGVSGIKFYAPIPENNIYSSLYLAQPMSYFDYIFQGRIYFPEMTYLGVNNVTIALPYYNTTIIISSIGLPRPQGTPSYYRDNPYYMALIFPTGKLNINPTTINRWEYTYYYNGYERSVIIYYNKYYNVSYVPFILQITDDPYRLESLYADYVPIPKNYNCFPCLTAGFIVSAYFDGKQWHSHYYIFAIFPNVNPYKPWKIIINIYTNSSGNYVKVSAIQNGNYYEGNLWAPTNLHGWWTYGFVKSARLWPYDKFTNAFYFYLVIPEYMYFTDFGIFSYPIYVESISNAYSNYTFYTSI